MRERKFELIVGRGGGGQLPHPDSNLRAIAYNPNNADDAKLTNFQGWRTSFYDEKLNTMIDDALIETDKTPGNQDYGEIQTYIEKMVPSIQPFSEVVDSVASRADIKGLALNPSWSTDLSIIIEEPLDFGATRRRPKTGVTAVGNTHARIQMNS